MRADFRIANAVERVEGPLVFLKRTVNVVKFNSSSKSSALMKQG